MRLSLGVHSEMELALAALHQLCAPMLDRLERLPGPQREALGTAFGISAGPTQDRFLIGLAVLGLLSDAAGKRPLVCLVDDQQWLDGASAQVLAFVAQRLEAESVGLAFAARPVGEELAGLPELVVEGLRDGDARVLLDSVFTGPLDARVRDQIIAETRGNPLALLELPRGLRPAELAGGFGLPGTAPLSGRIEESFQRQLDALPAETRRLVQLAAADPVGHLGAGIASRRAARDRRRCSDASGRGRAARIRRPSAVPASAGALDGLPVGLASGPAGDAPGAGGGHRSAARSRPPGLALGSGRFGSGRGRRSGAGAFSRPGAGPGGMAAAAAFLERAALLTREPGRRAKRPRAAADGPRDAGRDGHGGVRRAGQAR